ncbi:multicopper oxidase family protein [Nocardia macrotermitis]|uniref:Multicopper oxidase CueO n=1 Tax=Nocardia macrotermitis TaxID=2585198 RepID=A0A7K0DEA0_9NOCA|nr:multicopper oxidase domain-containing protein [Nocardia macrotermitis]MQY23194.1 Spore coat protein A [Nocardia macrotermitis]
MNSAFSRRSLFRIAAAVGVAGAAGAWQLTADSPDDRVHLTSSARLPEPFTLPLRVPSPLTPIRRDATTDYYRIVQRRANAVVLPGYSTPIWGYDGTFPGPLLVTERGRRAVITHRNELPVPVVVHLHGGHVPEASDGYPTDLLSPVDTMSPHDAMMMTSDPLAHTMIGERDYIYPAGQPAATLWYHDHRMDFTGASVWRGLAGVHLIVDPDERRLGLPSGTRDLPLLITDRAFDATGAFNYPAIDPTALHTPGVTGKFGRGVLGDVILVNGVPWPVHRVGTARHRLRLINGSNARVYRLRVDMPRGDGHFVQIGSDGGLLREPQRVDELTIAPGERYEVILDLSGCSVGDRVDIHNDLGDGNTTRVMRFEVVERVADTSTVPDRLSEIAPLHRHDAVTTRRFDFRRGDSGSMSGWLINGRPYDPREPIARPRLGEVEIWRLSTDLDHPIHLHLNQFQVLSRNGAPPQATDAGWKDTVYLGASELAEIAVRFTDYPGRYVLHCHNLEHEDMAMMATFTTHT